MKLQSIKHGLIVLHLTPDDAHRLAQACDAAIDTFICPEQDDLNRYLETAGAAFAAMTIASYAQWNMLPRNLQDLDTAMAALGLS